MKRIFENCLDISRQFFSVYAPALWHRLRTGPSGETYRIAGIVFLLAALIAISASFKYTYSIHSPGFSPRPLEPSFWTESAFHFRYARMVANGEPIPMLDRLIQFPEGLEVRKHITLGMEYFYGWIHRFLVHPHSTIGFHRYLNLAVSIFSSFNIFWVYAMGWKVWRYQPAAWGGALLYCIAPAVMTRTIGNFAREDFALFFLFGAIYFMMNVWGDHAEDTSSSKVRHPRWMLSVSLAALCLLVALASWHVSRFIWLAFVLWVSVLSLGFGRAPRVSVYAWTMFVLLVASGSCLIPVLREKSFLSSPGTILAVGLALTSALKVRFRMGRFATASIFLALGGIGIVAVSALAPSSGGDYSHVASLLAAKIRFLGIKPSDPSRLPFEAAAMWVEDFHSPPLRDWIYLYGTLVFFSLGALIRVFFFGRVMRERSEAVTLLFWWLFSLAIFVLVKRNYVFVVFFSSVLSGGMLLPGTSRKWRVAAALLFFMGMGWEFDKSLNYEKPSKIKAALEHWMPQMGTAIPNTVYNNRDLIRWVRTHVEPQESVLAWIGLSPVIAAYADRPVLLHSKFESAEIRQNYQDFIQSLYDSEEDFFQYCRTHQASYFVYQANFALDDSPDSPRYMASRSSLSFDSACFCFHFSISTLKRFQLVYQNPFYRVFRVCDRLQEHLDYGRETIFSPEAFAVDGALGCFDDSRSPAVLNRLRDANRLYQLAQQAMLSEEWKMAEGLLQEALDRNPDFAMGYDLLGQVYERQDYLGLADQLYSKALVLQPHFYPALLHRAGLLRKQGYDREALSTLEDAVRRDPGFADGYYQLGIFSESRGHDGRALDYIQKALELDPGFAAAFFQRGLLFEKKRQWDRARHDFLAAVDLDPENSHYRTYLHDFPARSIGVGEIEESITP